MFGKTLVDLAAGWWVAVVCAVIFRIGQESCIQSRGGWPDHGFSKAQRVHLSAGTFRSDEDVGSRVAQGETDLLARLKDGLVVVT